MIYGVNISIDIQIKITEGHIISCDIIPPNRNGLIVFFIVVILIPKITNL